MRRISVHALHPVYPHHTRFEPISLILISKHGLSVEPTPSLVREPSRWSTDVNLSVTAGHGRASSAAPGGVCSGQAALLSLRGVQDGQSCQSPLPSPRWRWQGGEKFHRSADSQENLTTNCWHQQHHSSHPYHGLTVCEAVPRGLTVWDSQSTSVRANRLQCSDTWWFHTLLFHYSPTDRRLQHASKLINKLK